ncbi:hypothetical protein [Thalassolituus sp.]|uniref:hypothetical protein n=1 Tax=Thalassolituus sp. TaxID=2030822 RepID=UPI00351325B8
MSHKINWSTALFLVSSPVMAASPYFPETPTIDTPADGATNVALNPELSGSALLEKGGSSGNLVFDSAEWRVSAPNDRLVVTGGTRGDTTVNLDSIPESTYSYDIPSGFNFNGVFTTRLEVTNTGIVRLIAADESIAATAEMRPGPLTDIRPGEDAPIIIVAPEAGNDLTAALAIQWSYLSDTVAGNILMQAFFTSELGVGFFTIPSDLEGPLFDSADSVVSINWTEPSYTAGNSLADWKTFLTGGDSPASNFGLLFSVDDENNVTSSSSSQFGALGEYQWTGYHTATASDVTLSDPGLMLEPATEYAVQVRYTALEGSSERMSDWSEPNHFTTDLNTDYAISALETDNIQASVPKELEFQITNNGSDTGEALIELRLPFNAFEVVDGDFSTRYKAFLDGSALNCDDTTDFDSGNTFLHCNVTLESGGSADVQMLVTFYSEGANTFDYRVCETLLNRCDDAGYQTVSFDVAPAPEIVEVENPETITEEESSSSSGGGSSLWLTLLALPLLRLRRNS